MAADTFNAHRAQVAALSRSRQDDDPDLMKARALMREARIRDYIRGVVDAAPPLPAEVRDRLAQILTGPSA